MLLPLLLATSSACETRILDYRTWQAAPHQSWHYAGKGKAGGTIELVGAEHLRDPSAPQFAEIDAAFAAAKPTVVFFEGPDRGLADNADAAIRTQGESGYVRYLAGRAAIPARSLEPGPLDQIAGLKGRFPDDQIVLFFVLREAARLRDREGKTEAGLDAAVTALLQKLEPLAAKARLATSIHDLPTLAAAARLYWPKLDWRLLPADWFTPGTGVSEARFLPAVNTAVSDFRNVHMVRLFGDTAAKGERVFVVLGRNHVPMLTPALDCRLAE
jgi:hypothetical protein